MSDCGLFDLGACFAPLISPVSGAWEWLTFWGPWIGWGLLAIAALAAIVLARKALGEPGALAAAGAIGAVIGAILARKATKDEHENLKADDPDAQPSVRQPRKRTSILGGSLFRRGR